MVVLDELLRDAGRGKIAAHVGLSEMATRIAHSRGANKLDIRKCQRAEAKPATDPGVASTTGPVTPHDAPAVGDRVRLSIDPDSVLVYPHGAD